MHYRPLPEGVTIDKSPIEGLGVFATKDIRAGVIGVGWVKHEHFPGGYVRTPLGGFINHSDQPNCEKIVHEEIGIMWLSAIRDIYSGEELTVKYTLYNV